MNPSLCFKGFMYKLILVSESPRRKNLLEAEGYSFQTTSVKISEIIKENMNLMDALKGVAVDKARAFVNKNKSLELQKYLVLTADTVVCHEGKVIGKPENKEMAFKTLSSLSGMMHEVITSICIYDFYNKTYVSDLCISKVFFKKLNEQKILDYINTEEPMDKAGAYGIQGEGKNLVENFTGSWSNIVGLPMETFKKVINENGWKLHK